MVRGRCLCGAVAYESSGAPDWMAHCHCSICRKTYGGRCSTALRAPRSGFRWLRGEDEARGYESSPGNVRSFCPTCGSVVPGAPPQAPAVFLPAGCLQDDPGVRPIAHIFVGSKAPWYDIRDGLPQFEEYPPGIDAPVFHKERASPAETPGAVGGSCLCGAVTYEVTGPMSGIKNCHCSRCRKASGAAHDSILTLANEDFRWLSGEDRVQQFKLPEARRYWVSFCSLCGSLVPFVRAGREGVGIPAGSLDDDPGNRETHHIYVGSKAPWHEISDGLPKFDEYPPASFTP